jgi:hypothetical protein
VGAMTCPRCGAPMVGVAARATYVQCGHQPPSTTCTPSPELLEAYERWAYGEGWTDGIADGHRRGFDEGFRAGFDAGAEVGAARLLLTLENLLEGRLPDLLPQLPHDEEYQSYRQRTAATDDPCEVACGRCSRCDRATAVAYNLRTTGHRDIRGAGSSERRPA